jgi:hypothetical protein
MIAFGDGQRTDVGKKIRRRIKKPNLMLSFIGDFTRLLRRQERLCSIA